jgi:histidinol-phosphate/aromatic aminotransferase/cobyric acid decarboxylase-like protein
LSAIPGAREHGGDGARLAASLGIDPALVLDLSASLNPVAPDPVPLVARHLDAVARYPDPDVVAATAALAEVLGANSENVLVTNGGSEAIALVAAEVGGHVEEPDFSLYARHLPADGGSHPDWRWRSNPHNPTGLLAGTSEQAAVWDEAFWPLSTGTWTRGAAFQAGALIIGSLTKLFACPGLRAGYVLCADTDLIARLRQRQPRWSVNGLAAAVIPDAVAGADLPMWAKEVARLRDDLAALLNEHGLSPRPSDANWLLVEAPGLRESLAPHGVLVRDCTSFGLPGVVRVAVPNERGLERLAHALSRAQA